MKQWTDEECESLCEQGLLNERYELIEGILFEDMLTSPIHALISGLLLESLASLFGLKRVRVEATIRLSEETEQRNQLVPDIAVRLPGDCSYRFFKMPTTISPNGTFLVYCS